MIISDEERRNTAYHEAGHALVAKLLPGADPVHKVTIIPRGRALGLTQQLPLDDRHTYSREFLLEQPGASCFGGRVAEELVLGQMTTGAGNDIERATELARKMVCEWGMSEKLGPLTFGKKEEQIFLGRDFAQRATTPRTRRVQIDAEVRRIVMEATSAPRAAPPQPRGPAQDRRGAARARDARRRRHRRSSCAVRRPERSWPSPPRPPRPEGRPRSRRGPAAGPAHALPASALDAAVVVGILNVTPDSFSDGGRTRTRPAAAAARRQLVAAGRRLLDVGGESTRPGAAPVPPTRSSRASCR